MALGKKLIITTIFVLFSSGILLANKSVFIISQHNSPSIAQAYKIDSSQVILQGYVDVSSYNQGYGAVGCATWPEKLIFLHMKIREQSSGHRQKRYKKLENMLLRLAVVQE